MDPWFTPGSEVSALATTVMSSLTSSTLLVW